MKEASLGTIVAVILALVARICQLRKAKLIRKIASDQMSKRPQILGTSPRMTEKLRQEPPAI
jgi:hypothetical protein